MTYIQDSCRPDKLPAQSRTWSNKGRLSEMSSAVRFPSRAPPAPVTSKHSPAASWRIHSSAKAAPNGSHGEHRKISPEVDIPSHSRPGGETFLVPSSCQSICQNYSDLHIGGDHVQPLSASTDDLAAGSSSDFTDGPFLQSCEIAPAMESPQPSLEYPIRPLRGGCKVGESCWRLGSAKDKSFLLHGEQPLSNSLLNRYLEAKLQDLYKQHVMESMANGGSPSTMLDSEVILTNVDQITLQLSREQNLEAAKAKDLVISCLLRVASGLQSTEISTPQLQISADVV